MPKLMPRCNGLHRPAKSTLTRGQIVRKLVVADDPAAVFPSSERLRKGANCATLTIRAVTMHEAETLVLKSSCVIDATASWPLSRVPIEFLPDMPTSTAAEYLLFLPKQHPLHVRVTTMDF